MKSRRWLALVVAPFATSVALAWAACSIYGNSLLLPAPIAEAGADAGGVDSSDPCEHALAPNRPDKDDPDGGDLEIVEAVTGLDLGFDAGTSAFSLDLDHTCTCPGPESCRTTAATHCDDSQGRDNSGGALFLKFSKLSNTFNSDKLNSALTNGKSGLLLRLRHYNGLANDTSVEFALFTSNGTVLPDGGSGPAPLHDGNDHWSASPASLLGGSGPPFIANYIDINAYVNNGVLVANADFPIRLISNANPFTLHGGVLTAVLVPQAKSFALKQGRLTGRWSARDLLTTLQIEKDPFSTTSYLCGNDVTYQDIKTQICKATDISSNVLPDPQAPCDALSLGLGFEAEPALMTGTSPDTPVAFPCGATYTDQCP